MGIWNCVAEEIARATDAPFVVRERRSVGGGCIHHAWSVGDGARRFFVKTNTADAAPLFEAEAQGLAALGAAASVRVPQVIARGTGAGEAFLVLEFLELGGKGADEKLGQQLATLHRVAAAPRFGFAHDNFIGATPQPNGWREEWVSFLRDRRLGHQLALAGGHGSARLRQLGEALLERLPEFFTAYRPSPSLLHGDLWSGNAAVTRTGDPVVFDPAVYYGDREAELAMTELFGGFNSRFYAAYAQAWPLDPGYAVRKHLYNLYHILNHFHLFGGGYADQAESMMGRLLAELH